MSIHDHSLVILESIEEHSKHLIDEISEFSEKHPIEDFDNLINFDKELNTIHNSMKALLEKMESLKQKTTFMMDPKIVELQEIIDLSEQFKDAVYESQQLKKQLKDATFESQQLKKQNKDLQEQLTELRALKRSLEAEEPKATK